MASGLVSGEDRRLWRQRLPITVAVWSSVYGVGGAGRGYVEDAAEGGVVVPAGEVQRIAGVFVEFESGADFRLGEEETRVAAHLHGANVRQQRAERLFLHGGEGAAGKRLLEDGKLGMLEDEGGEARIVPVGVVDDAEHAAGRVGRIEDSGIVGSDEVPN